MLIHKIKCFLRPWGLRAFIGKAKKQQLNMLDVGCGNRSSIFIKNINPFLNIFGIDVVDYNQSSESKQLYTSYLIVDPENFDESVGKLNIDFDLIISNHNIEHCNNPESTFEAMVKRLRVGGYMFIATPCLKSTNFPSRRGTLNFFDDPTHKQPIDLCSMIEPYENNLECIFYKHGYRPIFWRFVGFIFELNSRLKAKVKLGTWDYYGFEQIMWLRKIEK